MKKSILIATFILLLVVGWISSGQFSNNVVAQDENTKEVSETETSYSENSEDNESEEFTFSVETKIFTSSLIDQSIELQGQTIHNKKIDVKSETTGKINSIEFSRGDKVSENSEIKIFSGGSFNSIAKVALQSSFSMSVAVRVYVPALSSARSSSLEITSPS